MEYNPYLRRFDLKKGSGNVPKGSYSIKITIWDRYSKITNFDLEIIISDLEEQISIITDGDNSKLPQSISKVEIQRKISSDRQSIIQKRIQAVDGLMPPEVRIYSVSSDGKFSLTFTNEMMVPANFT